MGSAEIAQTPFFSLSASISGKPAFLFAPIVLLTSYSTLRMTASMTFPRTISIVANDARQSPSRGWPALPGLTTKPLLPLPESLSLCFSLLLFKARWCVGLLPSSDDRP